MVVDPCAQGVQQGTLSGVSPSGNHSDSPSEQHPPDACNLHLIFGRGHKGNRPCKRPAAFPGSGQDAAVGHKGAVPVLPKPCPYGLLLLPECQGPLQPLPVKLVHKTVHRLRQVLRQHLYALFVPLLRQLHLQHNAHTGVRRNLLPVVKHPNGAP